MTKILNKELMTKRQGWALYCITKKDYRNEGLTYDEASKLIKELGDPNYKKTKGNKIVGNDAVTISQEAYEAGLAAMKETKVIPMIVEQHASVLDDKSPVTQEWEVEGGCCGFAWIHFKANTTANRKFLAGLKKANMVGNQWNKHYQGGYQYWVSLGGQSMQRKEAFAHAYATVLQNHGIDCYVGSRMD